LALPLRCLVCGTSLMILQTKKAIEYFEQGQELSEGDGGFFADSEALETIHTAIIAASNANLVTASPMILSWSLILHRMYTSFQERVARKELAQNERAQEIFERENTPGNHVTRRNSAGSIVSLEPSRHDQFLTAKVGADTQVVETLARGVTAGGLVFELLNDLSLCAGVGRDAAFRAAVGIRMRLVFMDLLKASFPVVGYQAEPLSSFMSIISGGYESWTNAKERVPGADEAVAAETLNDRQLQEFYVYESLRRYPYEFSPFVSLSRILRSAAGVIGTEIQASSTVLESLMHAPTLTLRLPANMRYELFDEDANIGRFRTLEEMPLFPTASSWQRRRSPDEQNLCIPAGVDGIILADPEAGDSDTRRIVLLNYKHSTLALLGKRLDANLARDSVQSILGPLSSADVAEAISLLATLVKYETRPRMGSTESSAVEAALAVLQEASRDLSSSKDVVTVVCETLDAAIQDDPSNADEAILAVLAACVEFLHAILQVTPGRVWSYMARSRLLNTESRTSRLSALTGTVDLAPERFRFLASSVQFLSSLVDSVLSSAVQRKVGSKFAGRPNDNDSRLLGTSARILAQVTLAVAQTAVDVFENTSTWRFSSELDCSVLVRDVVGIMDKLIINSFSFGNPDDADSLTNTLKPAANYIVASFLSASYGALRFQPVLMTLLVALESPRDTLYTERSKIIKERLVAVINFAISLLRITTFLNKPSSTIETQLFKVTTLVARLCAGPDTSKYSAISLLESLVVTAARGANEPPSLLGYLGPQISKSFLDLLSTLDKPFNRPAQASSVWKFFTSVIKKRQQWMANCLLTGKTPRDALKGDKKSMVLAPGSVLRMAREHLRRISSLPAVESLAILEFFTSAQNHWPWTNLAIRDDAEYLGDLGNFVGKLDSASITSKSAPLTACQQARMAAFIAEICAMQLYHLRQVGGTGGTFAHDIVKHLDYMLRDGVTVAGYNASLHANFQRNFTSRYPGCTLDAFKHNSFAPHDLGPSYYYDLAAAGTMLSFDTAWIGAKNDGFQTEMLMANLNMSLVDAQVALFQAWEFLLLELGVSLLPENTRIVAPMLQVAKQCLESNQNQQGPAEIFAPIAQRRVELSLLLIQRLANHSLVPKDASQLLGEVCTTMNGVEDPFSQEQLPYYRTLLRTLFVVLRGCPHAEIGAETSKTSKAADVEIGLSQIILDILDRVVVQGFRTLVSLIHDPGVTVHPEDVALITAILQACLSIPVMAQCQTQIINILASCDALHVATSLFSWSDKLVENGDPVYGELSLLFLLELSTLPAVAEQLACDGLLGHITSANLAAHMRRPNVSPFSESVAAQRCYSIWSKALLPLLINILGALGATIAPEVAFVLNQFTNLLDSSVQRFDEPGLSRTASHDVPNMVALLAISEVHSLALLTRVLRALRAGNNRDIPQVDWAAAQLLENVEFLLSRPKLLRERLVPLGQRELEWKTTKPESRSEQTENKLEEKAVALLQGVRAVLSEGVAD
jgi:nuclear pore complex protein Nup188